MTEIKQNIKDKYIEHLLEHGKNPASVFKFCKDIGIDEAAFYDEFSSFNTIIGEHWKSMVDETIETIISQEEYQGFTVRDKMLTFFYTLIEIYKKNRSIILLNYTQMDKPMMMRNNAALNFAKERFTDFAQDLIIEGQETREFETRALSQFTGQYPAALWRLFTAITEFWIKDNSKLFEKTDSLIEKSVNTTLDFMGKSAFDGLLDLGKFLFQNINNGKSK